MLIKILTTILLSSYWNRKKSEKMQKTLSNTINTHNIGQMHSTANYRIHIHFRHTQDICKIDQTLSYKTNLKKFQKTQIIQSMFLKPQYNLKSLVLFIKHLHSVYYGTGAVQIALQIFIKLILITTLWYRCYFYYPHFIIKVKF